MDTVRYLTVVGLAALGALGSIAAEAAPLIELAAVVSDAIGPCGLDTFCG
jgi:hypothetical protein